MNSDSKSTRSHYLDNLRFLLVILVVIHHVGQAYGPTGGVWPVIDRPQIAILGKFFSINAGFFMGLLFFISGYVMPGALDKYGKINFLKSRLKKLIIPALFIVSVLVTFSGITGKFDSFSAFLKFVSYPEGLQQVVGHLWYIYHLLFYSICYLLYETLTEKKQKEKSNNTKPIKALYFHFTIIALVVIVAVASCFIRLVYPIDKWIIIFKIIPSEVAHLPQYLTLFVSGIISGKLLLFERIHSRDGYFWLAIGIGAVIFRYLSLGEATARLIQSVFYVSNSSFIVYVVWECVMCAGVCVGLLTVFRDKINFTNSVLKFHSENSYGLYLIHIFPIVGLQFLVSGNSISTWIKFIGVSLLSIYIGYFLIALLRKSTAIRRCL